MHGSWLFIRPVASDDMWRIALRAVGRPRECPWREFRLFVETGAFSAGIPLRLIVVASDDTIVAHSEIRDLGTDPTSVCAIAGLSNTVVVPAFRDKGIYTELIRLRNIIIDLSHFDCVAARVKAGYEERYMAQYPGFTRVKEHDPHGAAWLFRSTRGTFIAPSHVDSIVAYLEREVGKW